MSLNHKIFMRFFSLKFILFKMFNNRIVLRFGEIFLSNLVVRFGFRGEYIVLIFDMSVTSEFRNGIKKVSFLLRSGFRKLP